MTFGTTGSSFAKVTSTGLRMKPIPEKDPAVTFFKSDGLRITWLAGILSSWQRSSSFSVYQQLSQFKRGAAV